MKQTMKRSNRAKARALVSDEDFEAFYNPVKVEEGEVPQTAMTDADKTFFLTGQKGFRRVRDTESKQQLPVPDSNLQTVINLGNWERKHNLTAEDTDSNDH